MSSDKMPVLFIGHGSPMNAIETNDFTMALSKLSKKFAKPKAILMISAHWMTRGTWLTGQAEPKTIHDFYGFPDELFAVQYKAKGDPVLSEKIKNQILDPQLFVDKNEWGYDHGTWSVLKHIYPDADIPLIQLSLDMTKPFEYHFELGQKLQFLREQGVLIMGSGNIVHNLRIISGDTNAKPFDWAIEFDEWIKTQLQNQNHKSIVKDALNTNAGRLSIPTVDHYLPFLYILGASQKSDTLNFEFEGIQNASISMRCISYS